MTQKIDYLLIGHMTADIKPQGRVLGGTVSYAAAVVQPFGKQVGVLTSTAADEPLLDTVRSYAEVITRIAEDTSTFENIYTPDGRIQYLHKRAADLNPDHIPQGWLSAPLVHLAPLTDEVDPNIVYEFLDATILATPQGWMRCWDDDRRVHFKRWFEPEIIKSIDIIVFSEEDIIEAPELEAEIAAIANTLIVTRGDKGGTIYQNGEASTYEAYPVTETEVTGAGDVFAASLLASLPQVNYDIQAAVQVAARLAAISVTRTGTDSYPTPTEIQDTLTALPRSAGQ